jgi:hypothetical protein
MAPGLRRSVSETGTKTVRQADFCLVLRLPLC